MACKSIKAAADFINATYSVAEKVQLLLGPGVYKEKIGITLNPIMEVKSFNIQAGSDLCDDRDSFEKDPNNPEKALINQFPKDGQIPFMGQKPITDGGTDNLRHGKLSQSRTCH